MNKLPNFVTIAQYAKMCNITHMGVSYRIKTGEIQVDKVGGVRFIDIIKFPPKPQKRGRKKKND